MSTTIWIMTLWAALWVPLAVAESTNCRSFALRLSYDGPPTSSPSKCEKLQPHALKHGHEQVWTSKESLLDASSIEKAYITHAKPLFTQSQIQAAKLDPQYKPVPPEIEKALTTGGQPIINIKLRTEGALKFASITANNVHKKLAIILDEKLLANLVIVEPITDGEIQISSSWKEIEAESIVASINSLLHCK